MFGLLIEHTRYGDVGRKTYHILSFVLGFGFQVPAFFPVYLLLLYVISKRLHRSLCSFYLHEVIDCVKTFKWADLIMFRDLVQRCLTNTFKGCVFIPYFK